MTSALSDDDFTYGGTTYTIQYLYLLDAATDQLTIQFNTGLPSAIRAGGTLIAGANSLSFSSATIDVVDRRVRWDNPGFTWTDNQVVSLSITADTTAPTISTATVDGSTLVIDFNENLAAAAGLANSDFTVKVGGGSGVNLSSSPSIGSGANADKLTLTLQTAVTASSGAVTVSYAKPGTATNRLRDAHGNEVDAFTDHAVINMTGRTVIWSGTLTVDRGVLSAIPNYGCSNGLAILDNCSSASAALRRRLYL